MTILEVKELVEARLKKCGYVVGSDGVCTANTNEDTNESTTETTN